MQLALRYSELKKHFSISKFSLFDLLTPTKCRTVAIATATFGNASSALERLGRDPWNISATTLLETFGFGLSTSPAVVARRFRSHHRSERQAQER